MHIKPTTTLVLPGLLVLTAAACAGDDRDSGSSGVLTGSSVSAGTVTAGGTDTASSGTDSASGGGGSATATSGGSATATSGGSATATSGTGGTSGGGTSASGGILFDIGGAGDAGVTGGDGGTMGDGCKYLDILFIVDISLSMSEEKQNLADNFPNFVQVLDDYVNDPNNGVLGYRLGTTNSSFQSDGSTTGLDGALYDGQGGCGTAGNPWLDGPAANTSANFACLASNPKAACNACSDFGVERPLDTMTQFAAKHAAGQPNEGFYRGAESLLVIVTLTDEDDHGKPTPTSATKDALDTFAGGEERYVAVTISGPQSMGCTSNFGDAYSAPRLHEFTTSVPNGSMGDICQGDLAQPLADALEVIKFSCDSLPPPQG
jgi:hypothetical protein